MFILKLLIIIVIFSFVFLLIYNDFLFKEIEKNSIYISIKNKINNCNSENDFTEIKENFKNFKNEYFLINKSFLFKYLFLKSINNIINKKEKEFLKEKSKAQEYRIYKNHF